MSARTANPCLVLTSGPRTAADRRLLALARFCGVRAVPWRLPASALDEPMVDGRHLLADAATLHAWLESDPAASGRVAATLRRRCGSLIVTGLVPGEAADAVLRALGGTPDVSCQPLTGARGRSLHVASDLPGLTGALGGGRFPLPAAPAGAPGHLAGIESVGARVVASVSGRPVHAILPGPRPVHLVASRGVLDVDARVEHDFELRNHVLEFAPLFMALRQAFGAATWHRASCEAALMIDDPSLRPRHGHLRFATLLEELRRHDYAATIGFVPLSLESTHPQIAALFRSGSRRLGLCVHGCFHTRFEFGDPSPDRAEFLARTAFALQQEHERRTGVRCAPIMIFPHGAFTRQALNALARHGYVAAVNSRIHPWRRYERATVAEHLAIAMKPPAGVALFRRHHAEGPVSAFRVQAFLGQSILAGAHHNVCRNRLAPLRAFRKRVEAAIPDVHWDLLENVLRRSYLQRERPDGVLECLIVADEALVENRSDVRRRHRIVRPLSPWAPAVRMLRGDREMPARRFRGVMVAPLELAPRESALLRFETVWQGEARGAESAPLIPRRAASRRRACEIRDDLISRALDTLSPFREPR